MDNIVQQNQQNCTSTTSASTNNNVVIVNGSKIKGNFTGVSTNVNTDAACLITSNMNTNIETIVSSLLQQNNQAKTDIMNDGVLANVNTNVYNLNQTISNNISQINQATCSASQIVNSNNNYVYVSNSKIGGNFVGVSNDSTANASCSLNNAMKITAYNSLQSNAAQGNKVVGMFAGMLGTVVLILGLIIITLIVLFSMGSFSLASHHSKKKEEKAEKKEEKAQAQGGDDDGGQDGPQG